MNRKIIKISIVILLNLVVKFSYASDKISENKITPKDIINSINKNYPLILAQYQDVLAAEGKFKASQGVFDLTLKQEYLDYSRGFYDGKNFRTFFEKQNETLGSKIYGGYRKSYGNFEDYNGRYDTNNAGEIFAGISVPLLQNRAIDEYRLGKILAQYNFEESKVHLQNIKIQIKRDAIKAYWNWITSYEIYKTYEELYNLSLKRDSQLRARLEKGDVSEIVVVENKKNLLDRKNQTIKAKNLFEISAIYLSLFYRDENANPIILKPEQIPTIDYNVANSLNNDIITKDLEFALQNRAEIQLLKIAQKSEEQNLKYAKNLLQPKLDLSFEASKDHGSGDIAKAQSRNNIGLNLAIPLQFSQARGKKLEAVSKLESIKQKIKMSQDQINYEIRQLQQNISNIHDIFINAKEETSLAQKLEKAEQQRFKLGDSNFFLVNFREAAWADAKIKQTIALQDFQNYLADYEAKVFRLEN